MNDSFYLPTNKQPIGRLARMTQTEYGLPKKKENVDAAGSIIVLPPPPTTMTTMSTVNTMLSPSSNTY
jgi:hypothetical protein